MSLLKKIGISLTFAGAFAMGTTGYYTHRSCVNVSSSRHIKVKEEIRAEYHKDYPEQSQDAPIIQEFSLLYGKELAKKVTEDATVSQKYLLALSRYQQFQEEKKNKLSKLETEERLISEEGIPEFLKQPSNLPPGLNPLVAVIFVFGGVLPMAAGIGCLEENKNR